MSSEDDLSLWVDYVCNGIQDASGAQKAFQELTKAITELITLRRVADGMADIIMDLEDRGEEADKQLAEVQKMFEERRHIFAGDYD